MLRIVFIFFSLQFVKDAFYKWDGYSYYMHFMEFLPDLSLSYLLSSLPVIPAVIILWVLSFIVYRIISRVFPGIVLEHVLFFTVLAVVPFVFKRVFYPEFFITGFTGLGRPQLLVIGLIAVGILLFIFRGKTGEYAGKIILGIDTRITPLVWLFTFLLILSVPLSFMKEKVSDKFVPSSTGIVSDVKDRPNIVLLTMDALTALDMDIYGFERPTTPFISEWAKNAAVFQRYYAASNWTSPTVMSMMTGQRVWTHKAWFQTKYNPITHYDESLPRVLRDNGYDTYAFVQNFFAHPSALGLGEAFSVKPSHLIFQIISDWWYAKLIAYFEVRPVVQRWVFMDNPIFKIIGDDRPNITETLVPPDKVYDNFLAHIRKADSARGVSEPVKPFFAWIHVYPPHDPFFPPERYRGIFGDAEKYITLNSQYTGFNFYAAYDMEMQPEVDILRKRYDEFILYSDERFKEFLSRLADVADMSNTIIILSADHGESFSHGWLNHWGSPLFEPIVHLPLIIKMPGDGKGRKIDMLAEQSDLAPTILDIVGIPVPGWMDGRSLFPLIKGESLEPRPVLSMQFLHNKSLGNPIITGSIAVWEGDYKLIHNLDDGKSLLFNLRDDPDEAVDLVEKYPDITKRLRGIIKEDLAAANKKIVKAD
ncbi:MAG: sulfatase-like hydrolase/transferase [Nitrospirae bacterium]|nr:sulfatase-like hydrolase/transferase [Nitrospirota bacterium]